MITVTKETKEQKKGESVTRRWGENTNKVTIVMDPAIRSSYCCHRFDPSIMKTPLEITAMEQKGAQVHIGM